jgi:hypothetical protein
MAQRCRLIDRCAVDLRVSVDDDGAIELGSGASTSADAEGAGAGSGGSTGGSVANADIEGRASRGRGHAVLDVQGHSRGLGKDESDSSDGFGSVNGSGTGHGHGGRARSGLGADTLDDGRRVFALLCVDMNRRELRAIRFAAPPVAWDAPKRRALFGISMARADIERRKLVFVENQETSWLSQRLRALDFFNDEDLMAAQTDMAPEFFEYFHLGITCYLDGDWLTAREYLLAALAVHPTDAPTRRVLRAMRACDYLAPHDWAHCRDI